MVTDRDDLTVTYEENGVVTVKELDKCVLSKGSWTTILFKYQEWDPKKGTYGPPKYTIRRYQKAHDMYRMKAKFNISSTEQARKMVECLSEWIAADGDADGESDA